MESVATSPSPTTERIQVMGSLSLWSGSGSQALAWRAWSKLGDEYEVIWAEDAGVGEGETVGRQEQNCRALGSQPQKPPG